MDEWTYFHLYNITAAIATVPMKQTSGTTIEATDTLGDIIAQDFLRAGLEDFPLLFDVVSDRATVVLGPVAEFVEER